MWNAPKPVKRSHSKQCCKVDDDPLPIFTPCESLTANVNVVTQLTQECRHDDDDEIAASIPLCSLFRHALVAPLALRRQLVSIRWLIALLHERITKKQVLPLL